MALLRLVSGQFLKHLGDGRKEHRQILLHCVPQNLIVHVIISVAQGVTSAGDFLPRHGRIPRPKIQRQPFHPFAHDFEEPLQRGSRQSVGP